MIFDKIENLSMYTFANESLNQAIKHIIGTPIEENGSKENFQKNNYQYSTCKL
ncbi:hypothetical protein GCM10007063_20820 [Lentibacillus kapialis]|uniref:Uncharacterized protein n=1 Tax=Lentibacillus kapialis TaxID=340214 RepID=A0A917UYW0_9BACI|nr:hypothetical protein GCM10007063_20820 [Lentibacillus kapialis]